MSCPIPWHCFFDGKLVLGTYFEIGKQNSNGIQQEPTNKQFSSRYPLCGRDETSSGLNSWKIHRSAALLSRCSGRSESSRGAGCGEKFHRWAALLYTSHILPRTSRSCHWRQSISGEWKSEVPGDASHHQAMGRTPSPSLLHWCTWKSEITMRFFNWSRYVRVRWIEKLAWQI